MKVHTASLDGVNLLIPERFEDLRGSYMEVYDSKKFNSHCEETQFVQDDISISNKKQENDLKIILKFNIWDVYDNIMKGKEAVLPRGIYEHSIVRTSEKRESWEEWCEKVVWWCNKKVHTFTNVMMPSLCG